MNDKTRAKGTGPPGRPALPPQAEAEIMERLYADMRISSGEIAAILEKHGVRGDVLALQDSYRKRLGQLIGVPAKPPFGFVGRGGAREQTKFSPKVEMEWSGLCADAASIRDEGGRREVLAHGSEYVVVECCGDRQKLKAIQRRLQSQMNGLSVSAAKTGRRIRVLDRLLAKFRGAA